MQVSFPLLVPIAVLALASPRPPPPEPPSAWRVRHLEGTACRLESDKVSLNDGYQQTTAQVLVTPTEVKVVSESTFDGSAGDHLLIEVDRNQPVRADGLSGDKTVIFKNGASTLVSQFKAGLKARVQLRFWPSWPETGDHSATVSLIGFTKAWDEMQDSCH
jgi:hypothetical protein